MFSCASFPWNILEIIVACVCSPQVFQIYWSGIMLYIYVYYIDRMLRKRQVVEYISVLSYLSRSLSMKINENYLKKLISWKDYLYEWILVFDLWDSVSWTWYWESNFGDLKWTRKSLFQVSYLMKYPEVTSSQYDLCMCDAMSRWKNYNDIWYIVSFDLTILISYLRC